MIAHGMDLHVPGASLAVFGATLVALAALATLGVMGAFYGLVIAKGSIEEMDPTTLGVLMMAATFRSIPVAIVSTLLNLLSVGVAFGVDRKSVV